MAVVPLNNPIRIDRVVAYQIYRSIRDKNTDYVKEKTDPLKDNRLDLNSLENVRIKLQNIATLYLRGELNLMAIGHPEWTIDDAVGTRTVDTFKTFIMEHPYVSKYILMNGYRGGRSYKLKKSKKSKRSKRSKRSKKSRKSCK